MTGPAGAAAGLDGLRAQAIALRRAGLSLRQIRERLGIGNRELLNRLVKGEPPPEWTKRPNAKDELRERARALRAQGLTYDRIQQELGVSKSSISLWVRDLPKPVRRRTPEEAGAISKRAWEPVMRRRAMVRQQTKLDAAREIGTLSKRELFLIGVGLYWAEGAKDKPHSRRERVVFVNSDPDMIALYSAWLDLLGIEEERRSYAVMVHESADIGAAEEFWAALLGAGPESFRTTALKKSNPDTVRKNVGANYHGCLRVRVNDGAELYRRIEGWWYGIVVAGKLVGR